MQNDESAVNASYTLHTLYTLRTLRALRAVRVYNTNLLCDLDTRHIDVNELVLMPKYVWMEQNDLQYVCQCTRHLCRLHENIFLRADMISADALECLLNAGCKELIVVV